MAQAMLCDSCSAEEGVILIQILGTPNITVLGPLCAPDWLRASAEAMTPEPETEPDPDGDEDTDEDVDPNRTIAQIIEDSPRDSDPAAPPQNAPATKRRRAPAVKETVDVAP
jgi:hypothetical protein